MEKKLTGKIAPDRIRLMETPRPPQGLVERFQALGDATGIVSDVMDTLGITGIVGASLLKPTIAGTCIVGPALTVRNTIQREHPYETARAKVEATKRKYMVYYSERLHVESAVLAGQLIKEGAIGRVLHVAGFGPHRINIPSRPEWFFLKRYYGGILADIGSHQIEQFLYYSGASDAEVLHSKVANYNHKNYPELEDFGDATLAADNGATGYFRVDWFTPDGLPTWGDGRTLIMGTEGYIELRKYIDVGRDNTPDHLYLVNHEGVQHISAAGKVGFPFFGELILDCINRTENAMTQAHAFKAAELCLKAQAMAIRVE